MSVGRAKPTKESPRTLRARGLWGIRNRLTEDQFRAELVAIEQEAGQEIADGRTVELVAALETVKADAIAEHGRLKPGTILGVQRALNGAGE